MTHEAIKTLQLLVANHGLFFHSHDAGLSTDGRTKKRGLHIVAGVNRLGYMMYDPVARTFEDDITCPRFDRHRPVVREALERIKNLPVALSALYVGMQYY